MSDDRIVHYGVKGMKWGKRQAQVTRAANKEAAAKSAVSALKNDAATTRAAIRSAKRAAGEARINRQNAEFNAAGQHRIDKAGGSKAVANAKIIGRTALINMAVNVGGTKLASLTTNKDAKAAILIGSTAISSINTFMGVRDVIGVSVQKSRKND